MNIDPSPLSTHQLDAVFSALADPTRRAILAQLSEGDATVSELKAPFEMSQPAISRHLKVLEQAGLIVREVDAQKRPARLKAENIEAAIEWLNQFKEFWDGSLSGLDKLLDELQTKGD